MSEVRSEPYVTSTLDKGRPGGDKTVEMEAIMENGNLRILSVKEREPRCMCGWCEFCRSEGGEP